MQRQTGAAVESCRNEMVNQNGLAISAILGAVPQIPRHGQPHALPLIEGKD